MGNCFCNNEPYRQYVLKSDVYVNYTMDNLNNNFTTAKLQILIRLILELKQ